MAVDVREQCPTAKKWTGYPRPVSFRWHLERAPAWIDPASSPATPRACPVHHRHTAYGGYSLPIPMLSSLVSHIALPCTLMWPAFWWSPRSTPRIHLPRRRASPPATHMALRGWSGLAGVDQADPPGRDQPRAGCFVGWGGSGRGRGRSTCGDLGALADMQPVGRRGGSAVFLSEDGGQRTAKTRSTSLHCP